MSNYEKVLIGNSIPLPEMDDEEFDNQIEYAEIDADSATLIDNFGNEEFKYIYLNLYNEIRSLEIEKLRELCYKFIEKIKEYYDFEFTPIVTFDSSETIEKFLKFVEFIEFDYIDFFAKIIHGLDFNLLRKNLDKFIVFYWDKINLSINSLISTNDINEMITLFFRTNNKENIFKFIRDRLSKDKMIIILKDLENNEYTN